MVESANILSQFRAQPSHAAGKVEVTWDVIPSWRDAVVHVYRSDNGQEPWNYLGEAPAATGHFQDTEFRQENRLLNTHYRLLLENTNGIRIESPVLGLLGSLNAFDYKHARKSLITEANRIRRSGGRSMWLLAPLTSGTLGSHINPDTGQVVGVECPDSSAPTYGTSIVGGFAPPIQTYALLHSPVTIANHQDNDGMQKTEQLLWQAHLLPYPVPYEGHVLVDPASDNRYVVIGDAKGYAFKAQVYLRFDVNLMLLGRDDARYRVPVPIL